MFPEGLQCGLEKKIEGSFEVNIIELVRVTQLYVRRPFSYVLTVSSNGQTDKSGQRSRNVLPPFSSLPLCVVENTHKHTHTTTALLNVCG